MLDGKGRCCGRKPIRYKRTGRLFCWRCDREYSIAGEQLESFAWELVDGEFVKRPLTRLDDGPVSVIHYRVGSGAEFTPLRPGDRSVRRSGA